MDFLQHETARVNDYMRPLAARIQSLEHRMDVVDYEQRGEQETPREEIDNWVYYTRQQEAGSEQKLFCRRLVSVDGEHHGDADGERRGQNNQGEEQVLLDLASVFPTAQFLSLGSVAVSHDHKYLAFTVDKTGEQRCSAYVKNLQTGQLDHRVDNANCIEWANTAAPYMLYFTQVVAVVCTSLCWTR